MKELVNNFLNDNILINTVSSNINFINMLKYVITCDEYSRLNSDKAWKYDPDTDKTHFDMYFDVAANISHEVNLQDYSMDDINQIELEYISAMKLFDFIDIVDSISNPNYKVRMSTAINSGLFTDDELTHNHLTTDHNNRDILINYINLVIKKVKLL